MEFSPFRTLKSYTIDDDTNIQYEYLIFVDFEEVTRVEQYKYEKIKSEKELCYLYQYSVGYCIVEGNFQELCDFLIEARKHRWKYSMKLSQQ